MARTRGLSESGRDRKALAADAGFGSLSVASILAGVLVAYGAFAVLIGIAAAIVDALNVDTDIVSTDYEQLGIAGGLILAGILLLSYLFGGYVAGRMARRSGLVNGLLVAILGLAIAAAVAALVRASDVETINTSLRSLGVPTTADEYGQAFSVAGIASLAAILIGSLLGGSLGERWHGKLLSRAVDPNIGTEADARRQAQADMARAEEERTLAYDRARTANPARARRSDRDALADDDRRVLDDDPDVDPRRGGTGGRGGRVVTGSGVRTDAVDDDTLVGNQEFGAGRDRRDNPFTADTTDTDADADVDRRRTADVDDDAGEHRGFRRRLHRNDR
ncbi:MAG TPA: YrzE family protein [Acidimicrobiales bacterium]|nr:YrzE family protein [Acidimicrobiales bacterium]